MSFPHEKLRSWFLDQQRSFPWREDRSPYAVWVSEIMLQQTRASVVVPYFLNWMEKFPTVFDLARASLEEVIKCWEGLGYYSRAKNLQKGAQFIVEHFDGKIPSTKEELRKIPGVGSYTAGAILSFAFQKKAAALDGNVKRVLTRFFAISEDIQKPATVQFLENLEEDLLPEKDPFIISEALIELGAIICNKNPKCMKCPLTSNCKGFLTGTSESFPVSTKKVKIEKLHRVVLLFTYQDEVMIKKVEEGKIMSGLHEFPYFSLDEKKIDETLLQEKIQKDFSFVVQTATALPEISHSFTRYLVRLYPFWYSLEKKKEIPSYFWVSKNKMMDLAFSSGHRKILSHLFDLAPTF